MQYIYFIYIEYIYTMAFLLCTLSLWPNSLRLLYVFGSFKTRVYTMNQACRCVYSIIITLAEVS